MHCDNYRAAIQQFIQAEAASRLGLIQVLGAMGEHPEDQQIYAPPQANLGVAIPRTSPRLRFWLASLSGLLSAPVLFYTLVGLQAPIPVFPIVALAAWLGPLLWVLSSHRQLTGRITIGRFVVVAVGLALAMGMFAILGTGIATVLMVEPGFD